MKNNLLMTTDGWCTLFNYSRRATHAVRVGTVTIGGGAPVRLQSMTNTPTTDTAACVAQTKRIVSAGGEIVRLTTQGVREARNLADIKARLTAEGCGVPLVADVHFNAYVADEAALHVEGVRINPGNYVDPAHRFRHVEYSDDEYAAELQKIEDRLRPFLALCRAHGRAIRIGVNHGSLSDRIMSRYGDTPEGMVESCLEFLRVCQKERFDDVVISIKSSNTVVMVRTVRLLARRMAEEGMDFPLHLGVTEAGEGEDGRVKSAVGIGALLADGLGDTIRVSLSEAPEREIPVARRLSDYVASRLGHQLIPGTPADGFDYLAPRRRPTHSVLDIGGRCVPVVLASRQDCGGAAAECHNGTAEESGCAAAVKADFVYVGSSLPGTLDAGTRYVVDAPQWRGAEGTYPAFTPDTLLFCGACRADASFLFLSYPALDDQVRACLRVHPEMVVVAQSGHSNVVGELRALVHELWREKIGNPVIAAVQYADEDAETVRVKAAADLGVLCIDGLADGVMVSVRQSLAPMAVPLAFGILQAARLRTTHTEFVSCPGCGRTLYDLEGTIARIRAAVEARARTDRRFDTLKIGIMGCVVNGPGEMADADYGYVGAAAGKVSLYKGRACVEKNIAEDEAVERLMDFISADLGPADGAEQTR